jgi:hypothetical protein
MSTEYRFFEIVFRFGVHATIEASASVIDVVMV